MVSCFITRAVNPWRTTHGSTLDLSTLLRGLRSSVRSVIVDLRRGGVHDPLLSKCGGHAWGITQGFKHLLGCVYVYNMHLHVFVQATHLSNQASQNLSFQNVHHVELCRENPLKPLTGGDILLRMCMLIMLSNSCFYWLQLSKTANHPGARKNALKTPTSSICMLHVSK